MDYIKQLLQEHSRPNTEFIAKKIGNDPLEFKKIVNIIYKESPPLPQRAAWLLAVVNQQHPELLKPYLSRFIDTIEQFNVDAIKRNMSSVLAKHDLPVKLQGKAVDVLFRLMLSPAETVAVKTEAMQTLGNIARKHPELRNELKMAIEDQLPKTTAAFHARAKRIFKFLS